MSCTCGLTPHHCEDHPDSICDLSDEVLELREIAHAFEDRGKALNYAYLMKLSDRLMHLRAVEKEALTFFGWFNTTFPDPGANETHTYNRLGMLLNKSRWSK